MGPQNKTETITRKAENWLMEANGCRYGTFVGWYTPYLLALCSFHTGLQRLKFKIKRLKRLTRGVEAGDSMDGSIVCYHGRTLSASDIFFAPHFVVKTWSAEFDGHVLMQGDRRATLAKDAVPSIFDGCPAYLTKKVKP